MLRIDVNALGNNTHTAASNLVLLSTGEYSLLKTMYFFRSAVVVNLPKNDNLGLTRDSSNLCPYVSKRTNLNKGCCYSMWSTTVSNTTVCGLPHLLLLHVIYHGFLLYHYCIQATLFTLCSYIQILTNSS